jgi:hypothetical protein
MYISIYEILLLETSIPRYSIFYKFIMEFILRLSILVFKYLTINSLCKA